MSNWPLRDELTLAALPNAAFWARRHLENMAGKWGLGLGEEFVYRAKLVVTELVTNAAKASGDFADEKWQQYDRSPMSISYLELAGLGQIRLRLSSDGRTQLLVEVWDASDEPPVVQKPGTFAENGRGLLLVQDLCAKWGWHPGRRHPHRPEPGHNNKPGKIVWAVVASG